MGRYKVIIAVVLVLAVVAAVRLVVSRNGPGDRQLIQDALAESIKASKQGKPGGVMDFISPQLTVNDDTPVGKSNVREFIKNSRPDIVLGDTEPAIDQDAGEAQVVTSASVSMNTLGQKSDFNIDSVTIKLRRENAHDWLIFPTTRWRVYQITIPPDKIPAISF